MIRRLLVVTLSASCVIPAVGVAAGGTNWPQWRGPTGQGISSETGVPSEWSPSRNIAWKTAIPGQGHSQPIVWGDRLFLTTDVEGAVVPDAKAVKHTAGGEEFLHPDSVGADKQHTLKVLAVDAVSGRILWEQTAYEGIVFDNRHRKSSYAAATPVTDGQYVYAFFGAEGVYAYDFAGKLAWKASVGKIATLGLGVGASPVLYDNLLILQCDEDEGKSSFVAALDVRTGKEAWRTPRPVQVSWSTPVFVKANGRTEVVMNGTELVIAYDPATGKELWRTKGVDSNAIHTPLVMDDIVIVTAGYPVKRTIAIKAGGSGDVTGTERVLWQYDKGTAYVTTPILYDGLLYLISDRGIITCVDPRTGEVKYEGGRVPVPASFMGSPVAVAGTILLTSEDGDTFVIKAGPKHQILRTNSVGEPVYSSIAVAQGKIFIRGEKNLYCIG